MRNRNRYHSNDKCRVPITDNTITEAVDKLLNVNSICNDKILRPLIRNMIFDYFKVLYLTFKWIFAKCLIFSRMTSETINNYQRD